MEAWFEGFRLALGWQNLLWLLVGTGVGIFFGVLPGLGPMFAVALLLPLTFGLDPATAIIFLAAVHASTAYGDSIASILINTPGGGGSVAACWDGFPLAQQGKGGVALALSALSSFFGGFVGWLSLVLVSPLLVAAALRIGPAEMFMVTVLALSLLSVAVRGHTIKGLIVACMGLLLSVIGQDQITGQLRFTFGSMYLEDGLELIPVVVGLFALSQLMVLAEEGAPSIARISGKGGGLREALREAAKRKVTFLRGGAIGVFMGILPALGINSANIMAYLAEKNASKEPESFGKGNPAGLIAPEVAKSACVVGDLVPTLTLGVPGSPTTALLLAALVIHGLRPGPDFFQKGTLPYVVFAGILLAQAAFCLVGLLFGRHFARLVEIPNAILLPLITVLCFLGSYCARNRLEDVGVMIAFGVIGYLMKKYDYPPAALILGLVLGDLAESNFNRSLLLYGRYSVFFTRPIALVLLLVTIISLLGPYLSGALAARRARSCRPGGV